MITFDEALNIASEHIKDDNRIMLAQCAEYDDAYVFFLGTNTGIVIPQAQFAVYKNNGKIGDYSLPIGPDDDGKMIFDYTQDDEE